MVARSKKTGQKPPPLSLDHAEQDTGTTTTPFSAKKPKVANSGGRQMYSCAECRRLKLKCSRIWPCVSCEKRGCAQICPVGQMMTGKGKRLILADTEELHERISTLEVALAQAHAITSSAPHPLLASPYLFTPRDPANGHSRKSSDLVSSSEVDYTDVVHGGLGTLTISPEGEARFVGSFAGSEYLGDAQDEDINVVHFSMPTPPSSAPHAQPGSLGMLVGVGMGQNGTPQQNERMREQLPVWESEGRGLVEAYWENVNWMYQILPRPMFDADHLVNAYDATTPANACKIACVYLVMALGAIFDLNRQSFDPRADELFEMGRSCLNAVALEHASPATVQALHLCGTYLLNDRGGHGGETFWPILGSAIKIAQSLGLHRDGAAFGLSPYEIAERRQVWWEIITYDRLQALCFGRPCATTNAASDTSLPTGDPAHAADTDGFHRAKYRLIAMMEKIIEVQTQTAPVSVQQIGLIDKQFREFKSTVPEALLPQSPIQDLPLDPSVHPHMVIHRLGLRLLIAQSRLLLNRPLFAMALKDHAEDPSQSRFGESFTSLYESAQEIVQLVKQLVIYHPSLVSRWWFFWFHAFTASVCLGAITIRAPTCAFASPAFHGLTAVCDISAAAAPGCRAKKGLPVLLRLKQRAKEALVACGKTHLSPASPAFMEDDDLSHLASPTRLLRINGTPTKKRSPTSADVSPQFGDQSPQSPRSVATSVTLNEQLHYDPIMGTLFPLYPTNAGSFTGAVQPPPMDETISGPGAIETPMSDGAFSFSPFFASINLEPGRMTMSNQVTDDAGAGLAPSEWSPPYNFGHFNGYPIPSEMSESPTHIPFSGQGDHARGADSAFEMFINQLGAGDLGLNEAWNS